MESARIMIMMSAIGIRVNNVITRFETPLNYFNVVGNFNVLGSHAKYLVVRII